MLTAKYLDDHIKDKSWLVPDQTKTLSNLVDMILNEAKNHIAADGSKSTFDLRCIVTPVVGPTPQACVDIGINNIHIVHL